MRFSLFNFLGAMLFIQSMANAPAVAQGFESRMSPDHFLRTANQTSPILSPSGRYLAFVDYRSAGASGGNLAIFDLDSPGRDQVSLTDLSEFSVRDMVWANDQRLLIVIETMGYVEYRGHRVSVPVFRTLSFDPYDTSQPVAMFQNERDNVFRNVNNAFWTGITDLLESDPNHVLMPAFRGDNLDLWRVNVFTGDAENIERGNNNTGYWFSGSGGEAVMRVDVLSNGRRFQVHTRAPGERRWQRTASYLTNELAEAPPEFEFAGHGDDGSSIYVFGRPEGQDVVGVYPFDLAASTFGQPVASSDGIDITRTIVDTRSRALLGYVQSDRTNEVVILDEDLRPHFERIRSEFSEDTLIVPDAFRGNRMIFTVSGPDEPGAVYLFDASRNEIVHLRSHRPSLRDRRLSEVRIIEYTASDGMPLFAYLTVPRDGLGQDTPLLLLPHGGPEARDYYGFDLLAQFYAGSGYAVLQPAFRGSAGFGRAFAEAGYGEWGGLMQSDLMDALSHILDRGYADADRVCIGGFSYGGYAALMGGVAAADRFQCVFAVAPVTDLRAFVEHWQDEDDAAGEYWEQSIGHPRRDRDRLEATSPTELASAFTAPVFIAHGVRDAIVPFGQSEIMADALDRAGIVHDFAIYDRADHSFSRRADMRSILRLTRQLMDRTIGPDRGEYEDVFADN
ncbi:alpha/beta hydrolase family protein [Hyphobacterium sp.]|uniref:alpha/beta hydrolase family protein n=1 Tax=Hyphobacterium sp. TaxID=2004662 RepID=UPI003BA90FD3